MCFDGVAHAGRRGDRPAEEDVVGEDEVGRQVAPQGGRVQLDVALTLGRGQLREPPCLQALVAVEDEDRQRPPDLRPHRVSAAEVVLLRPRFLREDDDVVPGQPPGAGQ